MNIKSFVKNRPYLFTIIIFTIYSLFPAPIVISFKLLNLDMESLRLIIPIANSIFAIAVLYYLGWLKLAGFRKNVQDIHVLWFLLVVVFVPTAMFGTVQIAANAVLFYLLAVFFTGVSEEAFSRGVIINALLQKGKWPALLFAAVLFSIAHFSNLLFENFSFIEMLEKLWLTFSAAILYGALYLRTRNIWPLIVLHTLEDFIFVTSGTAGPFTVTPLPASVHVVIGVLSIGYAIYIARKIDVSETLGELEKSAQK